MVVVLTQPLADVGRHICGASCQRLTQVGLEFVGNHEDELLALVAELLN
jgi:hypothetical protein